MAPLIKRDNLLALRHHDSSVRDRNDLPRDRWIFAFLEKQPALGVILVCFILIALIGLVDYQLGPELSLAIFYLIPIAIAAWWGGFSYGILFSLTSTVIWHLIDMVQMPDTHPVIRLWNGVVRFGFFVITSSLLSRLRLALRREQALARTDPLTGVANGRTFYEKANLEIHRFQRTGRPFTLVYLDLDNFKEVNDRRGHLAGDELLQHVAATIVTHTRLIDLIARLGGDEFVLLLPETDSAGAVTSLTKLRQALLREAAYRGWPITYSIGAATFLTPPQDVDLMIQRVDALMYKVKRTGKNRIQHEVLRDATLEVGNGTRPIERRATVRIICNQAARVSIENDPDEKEEIATIRNVSSTGIGIRLGCQMPQNTLLTIEPLCSTHIKTLLARVQRHRPDTGGWFHGCELATRLSEEDLQEWLTEATMVTLQEEAVGV